MLSRADFLPHSTVARDGNEIFLVSVMENEAKGANCRICSQT
jgi:hypothetical protein